VIGLLAATVGAFALFDSDTSVVDGAAAFTAVTAVALLFAVELSVDVVVTVAVLVIEPLAAELTATTSVNDAVALAASDELVAVTVPDVPGAGVDGVQPAGTVNETNVAFAGSTSLN
jgi:hypothetical protein